MDTYGMVARAAQMCVVEVLRGLSMVLVREVSGLSKELGAQVERMVKLSVLRGEEDELPMCVVHKKKHKEAYATLVSTVGSESVALRGLVLGWFEAGTLMATKHVEVWRCLGYLNTAIADELDIEGAVIKELRTE